MAMAEPVQQADSDRGFAGKTFGRWTVLRKHLPGRKRPTDTGLRARVHVRCVCGHEKIAWYDDLRDGRSTGCKSIKCAIRSEEARDLSGELDAILTGDPYRRQLAHRLKARITHRIQEKREREERLARERIELQLAGEDGES